MKSDTVYAIQVKDKLFYSAKKMDVLYFHQNFRKRDRAKYLELSAKAFKHMKLEKVAI